MWVSELTASGGRQGPARNSRPRGISRAVKISLLPASSQCDQHTNAGPCQGDPVDSLDGLLRLEDSATTRRSKRGPLHTPSLFFLLLSGPDWLMV